MALSVFSRKQADDAARTPEKFVPAHPVKFADDPLERALQMGRFGRVLQTKNEWRDHPHLEQAREAAEQAIDEQFGLVPDGFASVPATIDDQPGAPEIDHEVNAFLLARNAVSNAEFQMFVDDQGYQELNWWPEELWPHLIDFKDLTGQLAPRFWREGRHDRRRARHPVVGVCYYEVAAYTKWVGFRLPMAPEWQMAASWRIRSSANVQRRYPWGDTLDPECCNIWTSGHGHTLPVDACPAGGAPNGVLQLIGNTWEWVEDDFDCKDDQGREVVGEMLMKCIRGGAYDTYFAWQATSSFQTGLACLTRTANVGFRCATSMLNT